jgi:hypothetical protein
MGEVELMRSIALILLAALPAAEFARHYSAGQ